MKNVALFSLFACSSFLMLNTAAYAQKKNRMKPGELYEPGAIVQAPRFGVESKIPEGWEGSLPRDTETFLLTPRKSVAGEIYIWGMENDDPERLKKRWREGVDMGSNIFLKAKEPISKRGDVITADAELSGSTNANGRRMYAEARCSSFGICVVYLLLGEPTTFELAKKDLQYFVDQTILSEPKNISIYEGFDWKGFLEGHMLMSIESAQKKEKLNEVHFCADGTFYSSIKRKGLLKEEIKEYQGNKTGTWSVEPGQRTMLVLKFTKAPEVEIELFIDNEKVYANGERHFVGYSERCDKK